MEKLSNLLLKRSLLAVKIVLKTEDKYKCNLESDSDQPTSIEETAYCVECCNLSPGWIREVNEEGKVFYHPPEGEVIDSKEDLQKVHGKDLTNFDFLTGVWKVQECSLNIVKDESLIKEEEEENTDYYSGFEYSEEKKYSINTCSRELINGKKSTLTDLDDKVEYNRDYNEVKKEIPSDDEYGIDGIIFPCIKCNEVFQTSNSMLKHAISHTGGETITPDTLFVSIHPLDPLDDGITTIKQDNKHREEECKGCKKKYKQIKMHLSKSTVCNSYYKSTEDCSDNLKVFEQKGTLSFTCRGCNKNFKVIATHIAQSSKCRIQYSDIEIESHKRSVKQQRNRKNYIENREKILKNKSKYYEDNKEKIDKGEIIIKQSTYYEDNKEKILEKKAKYYKDNKVKILGKMSKYYEDNKEKRLDKMSKYYENVKGEIIIRKSSYYEDNKEKILLKKAKYYKDNKEKILGKMSKYYEDNKEKRLEKIPKNYEDDEGELSVKKSKYYQDKKEKLLKKMSKYYKDNKDKISRQKSKYYKDKKKKRREQKSHYVDNTGEQSKKKSKYYTDSKEKILEEDSKYNDDDNEEIFIKYNEDNTEEILNKKTKYNEENTEKLLEKRSRYDVEYQKYLNGHLL